MDPESDSNFMATHEKPGRNYAKFYLHPVKNNNKSREAGREIYEDKEFILILCPGQTKSECRRPVQEKDKQEYPQAWADFQNGNKEPTVSGVPIEHLPGLSPARARELRSAHIFTVEQMAECADTASQTIGMDFNSLKNTAQAYISKSSPQVAALEKRVAELTAKLEALTAAKPRGRPRKQLEEQVAA